MRRVEVVITEILSRSIFIDVPDEISNDGEYAEIEATKKYHNEEIVLDSSDYIETEIKVKMEDEGL